VSHLGGILRAGQALLAQILVAFQFINEDHVLHGGLETTGPEGGMARRRQKIERDVHRVAAHPPAIFVNLG
jgi:hypothetical protein